MLDRLPPELLHHILLLAPSSLPRRSHPYWQSRAYLQSYSLICRAVSQTAQPLLWSTFRLRTPLLPELLLAPRLAKEVRMLKTWTPAGQWFWSLAPLFVTVQALPNLVDLRLKGKGQTLKSEQLALLTGLEHLMLRDIALPLSPPLPFSNLVTLSYHSADLDVKRLHSGYTKFFSPSSFPSLRAVYTDSPILFSTLFAQLDMLQVQYNKLKGVEDILPPSLFLLLTVGYNDILFFANDSSLVGKHFHVLRDPGTPLSL